MNKIGENCFNKMVNLLRRLRKPGIVHNISKVYSGTVFSQVFAFGTLVLLVRSLSTSSYAVYTVFYAIRVVAPNLVGNGVNRALVRFSTEQLSLTGRRPVELYLVSFISQIVLYVGFCAVLLLNSNVVCALLFGEEQFAIALRYGLTAGLGLLLTQAARSVYQAEEKFGTYVKILWLHHILIFLAVLLLFVFGCLNFQYAAQSIVAIELGIGAIAFWHIFKLSSLQEVVITLRNRLYIVKEFLASTRWLIAYFVVLAMFEKLDIFMLSHLCTKEELANYGVAFRCYALGLVLLGSIHTVLLPKFSKVDMQDAAKQRQFVVKWLKLTVWLIFPIAIAIFAGKPLFVWITRAQYERAFYMLMIFSVGIWLSLMFGPLVSVIMSKKAFRFLFGLAIGALSVNFCTNYLLIPFFGGIGAVAATILSHNLVIQGALLVKVLRRTQSAAT